jgi:hypothetical protein
LSLVAKARIEIFRSPKLFDDHFCKNWSLASGGTSSWSKDGDIATINSGNQPYGSVQRVVDIDTSAFGKLIVRVASGSGAWSVSALVHSGWIILAQGTGPGLFEVDLPSGETIGYLVMNSVGVGVTAKFDYLAICKYALLVPDLGDIVESLTVIRPVLRRGITSASFIIPNFAGAYNGLISEKDVVLIWQTWTESNLGDANYKTFGGTVVKPGNKAQEYGGFYVTVDCEGWGAELNVPPALLQKQYVAVNGRTIIEDALGVCGYLARHPTDAKWFDCAGASGSTDDRIDSTHDVTYEEIKPLTVIQEIAEKAKNPAGLQGFELYETPAGCLVGHLRNSLDFSGLSFTPRTYARSSDSHRVRNKKKVYGAFGDDAETPIDENWTENTINWTAITGAIDTDAIIKYVGACSIKLTSGTLGGHIVADAMRNFRIERYNVSQFKKTGINSFAGTSFYMRANPPNPTLSVRFLCPDISNYYYILLYPINAWELKKLEFFGDETYVVVGNPDPENMQGIEFYCDWGAGAGGTQYLYIDGLKLFGGRFYGLAEDVISQGKYGVCVDEPEIDEALQTTAECQIKAQALVAFLKDPVITFTENVTDGDHRYRPSERQMIVVANDNLMDYYPAIEVRHEVRDNQWDTILTLADEPQYLDLVFRMLEEKKRLLERR